MRNTANVTYIRPHTFTAHHVLFCNDKRIFGLFYASVLEN